MKKIIINIKYIFQRIFSREGSLFRYSFAFCLLLALLPTLMVIIFLFKQTSTNYKVVVDALYLYVPKEFIYPFVNYIIQKDYHSLISLGLTMIAAMLIASKSFYSFMLICNDEKEPVFSNTLIRIKSFITFIIFIILVVLLGFFNNVLPLPRSITFLIGLILIIYYFYRTMLFEKKPLEYGILGSVISAISIVLIGLGFLKIISTYTRYDSLYGPLVAIVIIFLAAYIISTLLYIGYVINEMYYPKTKDTKIKLYNIYNRIDLFIQKITNLFNK